MEKAWKIHLCNRNFDITDGSRDIEVALCVTPAGRAALLSKNHGYPGSGAVSSAVLATQIALPRFFPSSVAALREIRSVPRAHRFL